VRRTRRSWLALVLLVATAIGGTACAATARVSGPGGKRVRVQYTRLGTTLRTDRRNTVTVAAYRSLVGGTRHEQPLHGMHFEAADVRMCARTSGGVVGPSMVTLRTTNNHHVLASASTPIGPPLRSQQLARGRCTLGWVAFDVPSATTGAHVVVFDGNDDSMRWSVH
jgi:hypothetical protein